MRGPEKTLRLLVQFDEAQKWQYGLSGRIEKQVLTIILNTVIAKPLVLLSNISENTAATTVSGAAPKKPPQKRQISVVCKSFDTATATWKMEKPKLAMTSGSRRPFSSENGAQIIGPVATGAVSNRQKPRALDAGLTEAEDIQGNA